MNDKQNQEFMNHPDRVAAQARVNKAKARVRGIQTEISATQTILTLMPPAMQELDAAYADLLAIEARLEFEIIERDKKRGATQLAEKLTKLSPDAKTAFAGYVVGKFGG